MGDSDEDTTIAGSKAPEPKPGKKRPYLLVLSGSSMGRSMHLTESGCLIGRSAECNFVLDDEGISRKHAKVVLLPEGMAMIKDLGSTNGTFVNEHQIEGHPLEDGDRIRVGSDTMIRFGYEDEMEVNVRQHLFVAATRDALTGLHNKRSFDEQALRAVAFSKRHGQALSFVVFDIDHFKQVNDNHGHTIGDEILKGVARRMSEAVRVEDVLARVGGEEFVVILPAIDLQHAVAAAARLRAVIAKEPFETSKGPLGVRISLGAAQFDPRRHASPEHLMGEADERLYEAKRAGRDCVRPEPSRHSRRLREANTIVDGATVRAAARRANRLLDPDD